MKITFTVPTGVKVFPITLGGVWTPAIGEEVEVIGPDAWGSLNQVGEKFVIEQVAPREEGPWYTHRLITCSWFPKESLKLVFSTDRNSTMGS